MKHDTLESAMKIILEYDYDKVAVCENGALRGYIRSRDIFNAYLKEMKASR